MNISLSYVKDCFAFITAVILFIIFYIFKIKQPKLLFPFLLLVVITFDGIFTFYPYLHNKIILQNNIMSAME
mgnify:CR=1 FL=1